MLCKIDATQGTTDVTLRALNFMRAVRTVMTAESGSTPTCNVLVAPNVYGTTVNLITEVVANVEAGGWTVTANSNITDNYSTTYSSYYQVDFVSNIGTGKTTYPYLKCTLSTNNTYPINNASWPSYPWLDFRIGFNDTQYYNNTYAQAMTVANTTANILTAQYTTSSVGNATDPILNPTWGEYLVASTGNYVTFISANSIMYFGYRTTNAWENAKADNPPVVGFATWTRGWSSPPSSASYGNAMGTAGLYCAWMYSQDGNATTSATPRWFKSLYNPTVYGTSLYQIQPLSGTAYATGSITSQAYASPAQMIGGGRPHYGLELASPLLQLRTHSAHYWQQAVTDTLTKLQIPPAVPINFWSANIGNVNSGGTAIGIYKSLSADDRYLANVWSPASSYIVNGDAYYSYRTGFYPATRDVFLIKKS